jgi:hypothetical protein
MPLRRCIAALVTFVALAAPGAALAQSAGDDQYQDPFGGSGGSSGGSGGSGGSGSSSGGSSTPSTPAAPAAPTTTTSSSSSAPATTAQAPTVTSRSQLPYTGSPVAAGLLAAAGGVLLAGGLTLRVRLRERDAA